MAYVIGTEDWRDAMLDMWLTWWDQYGADWYKRLNCPYEEKPPYLKHEHPLHCSKVAPPAPAHNTQRIRKGGSGNGNAKPPDRLQGRSDH